MTAPPKEESFDPDALISLENGVQKKALEAFLQGILDGADAERRREVVRFAYRAGWRVLPEILADNTPKFEEPLKSYVFVASCRALFWATHPDVNAEFADAHDLTPETNLGAVNAAACHAAAYGACHAATGMADVYEAAAYTVYQAAAERRKPLLEPLLLAMREDLIALHSNQTLAGRELWPKESASLFDVRRWLSAFQKDLERYTMPPEISEIYEALFDGSIDEAIREYKPNSFEELFESTKRDYEEWQNARTQTINVARDTLHSELPSDTDYLDQEPLAEALSRWLNKNHSHTAIGLFGDWGVGKSTFVNLLRNHLNIPLDTEAVDGEKGSSDHYKTEDYIGGEFNAWQYEHTDNIQAGLAQELIAALRANLNWWEKKRLIWRYHSLEIFFTVIYVLAIVVIGNVIFQVKDASWFSWMAGIGSLGIGGSFVGCCFSLRRSGTVAPVGEKASYAFPSTQFCQGTRHYTGNARTGAGNGEPAAQLVWEAATSIVRRR